LHHHQPVKLLVKIGRAPPAQLESSKSPKNKKAKRGKRAGGQAQGNRHKETRKSGHIKQRPLPEKRKPTHCASGSIVSNSAPCGKPVNTANITHAANAANITRPANISRASNNANIANIPNISRVSNNANIAHITNAAKFTPAAHKACCSFAPRFPCSFAHFGSFCPRKSAVSHIVPRPCLLLLFLKLRFQALKEKQKAIAIRYNLDRRGSFT